VKRSIGRSGEIMKHIASEIRAVVDAAEKRLIRIPADEASQRDEPDGWSKQEILGHLIDSAANNHQRFVRACSNQAMDFPPYDQEEWARVQRCCEADWGNLVSLWASYNRHLSHVIEGIPESALSNPCSYGAPEPVTLEFVVHDYLRHLKHHLGDLL